MKKIGLYLMGKKGYQCLLGIYNEFGKDDIAYVISARDEKVQSDFYEEIRDFSEKVGIRFFDRSQQVDVASDINFAIGWRWLIKSSGKLVVFHDSLLPRYRGFSPLVNMLINGEREIGVTAILATEKYDEGDILGQLSTAITYPIKISEAIDKVSFLYEKLIIEIVSKVRSGVRLHGVAQVCSDATYSLWRNDADYQVNWSKGAGEISRFVDAVGYPYAGAKTKMNGSWVRILDADIFPDVVVESRSSHIGKVIFVEHKCPVVVCGEGLLKLTDIVDELGRSVIDTIPFRTRFGV